jgi:16S rRNA (cytidine1402-2'-O)-methyltransferase
VATAKELTKLHETLARGTLDALAAQFGGSDELKGEFVVVVAPPSPKETEIGDTEILAELKLALKRGSFRDAVRDVAEARGVKRARVYELGLSLKRDDNE